CAIDFCIRIIVKNESLNETLIPICQFRRIIDAESF
ncbi:MAG: hypothetical protein UT03_C0012G0016, partial [Candidatus Moranbacteria bacterium GW2011_GWD2_38_7]